MSLEVRIDGADAFKRVARQIREEGDKDLSRQMGEALSRAAEPVKKEIRRETEAAMPSEGGYRSLISASLAFRMSRRAAGGQRAQLIVTTYADGTKDRRDIKALNRGKLRHPVFGRSRRIKTGHKAGTILANPWAVTSVRGGFFERGTEDAADKAAEALAAVVDDFARRLIK